MSTNRPIVFAPSAEQYGKLHLNGTELETSPIAQFHKWFKDATDQLSKLQIPEKTTFSTCRLPSGRVLSRVVLLKELDERGFIVYSNWSNSKKALDFESNKYAGLNFFWGELERQVRVEGVMEKVSRETTVRYFNTRPRGSKIGAWASAQSQVLQLRDELDGIYKQYEDEFKDLADDEIPCPDYWGGVRIVPFEVEFWQGGKSRLHDRFTYVREDIEAADWEIQRLAP
ncbi:pyridoxiamine phosphate oxidase [Metschnikowia bicuspidata]|uniref:pyridoxal 5'-phosphate synthase n=1 Tax=Metschnikowia bicuspidata TaxID=27322 RepID=A0A4P9ZAN6_9ASCO|nr:pyridoxiamine phosphate oxidase [Metschnikowia bicuspidata]